MYLSQILYSYLNKNIITKSRKEGAPRPYKNTLMLIKHYFICANVLGLYVHLYYEKIPLYLIKSGVCTF